MKYTLVPPNAPPVQHTASCPEIGRLLVNSPDGDLTINQTRNAILPGPIGVDFELRMQQMFGVKNQ
jgi:hypothetical protein